MTKLINFSKFNCTPQSTVKKYLQQTSILQIPALYEVKPSPRPKASLPHINYCYSEF